jgi:NADPH:quinone reductase-like Zn-dependent oxidoreductase
MKAIVLHEPNGAIAVGDAPKPEPGPGDALVKIRAAALNHRDVWIWKGQYAGLKFPIIVGSDGVGTVESVGPLGGVDWVGRDVIINPSLDWGSFPRSQDPNTFRILGLPDNGTLAEYLVVNAHNLVPKPSHLSDAEAAALPLAGLTAFRAVSTRGRVQSRERVLVTGAGGGVATFAVQFAAALGAQVWVTSGSDDKLARAKELGALGGVNYKSEGWDKALQEQAGGPFDLIVDSAGGAQFNTLLEIANYGGRIVFFGATLGNVPDLGLRRIFWKQLSVLGTTMGSPFDFDAMVQLVADKQLRPAIDQIFPLSRAADAFARMANGEQFGKIVIDVAGEEK